MARQKLIHLHTTGTTAPKADSISLGEIAVAHQDSTNAALYVKTGSESGNTPVAAKFITEKAIDARITAAKNATRTVVNDNSNFITVTPKTGATETTYTIGTTDIASNDELTKVETAVGLDADGTLPDTDPFGETGTHAHGAANVIAAIKAVDAAVVVNDGQISALQNGTNTVKSFAGNSGAITIDDTASEAKSVKFAMSGKKLTGVVMGLGSAALENTTAFDAKGAASDVLGKTGDTSDQKTVYGALKGVEEAKTLAGQKVDSIAHIGDTAINVESGDTATPKIGLLLDPSKGNVTLSQSNAGLKASIDLGAYKVKSVSDTDKVLSNANGVISSTISFSVDPISTKGDRFLRLKGIGGTDLGSVNIAEFVKDGMLKSGKYNSQTKEIELTLNTDGGDEVVKFSVADLIDTYTAKKDGGLLLEGNAFEIDKTIVFTQSDWTAAKQKITGKIEKADNYYVSDVTLTNGALSGNKVQLPVRSVTDGDNVSGKGTIKVNGSKVSVYGLGTAAYTNSDAYDVKNAASTVKSDLVNGETTYNTFKLVGNELRARAENLKGIADGKASGVKETSDHNLDFSEMVIDCGSYD